LLTGVDHATNDWQRYGVVTDRISRCCLKSKRGANAMSAQIQKTLWPEAGSATPLSVVELAGKPFDFGSGHHHAAALRHKKCIIYRSQTVPALMGFAAEHRVRRIQPSAS